MKKSELFTEKEMSDTKMLVIKESDSFLMRRSKDYANKCIFNADRSAINSIYYIAQSDILSYLSYRIPMYDNKGKLNTSDMLKLIKSLSK